MKINLKNLLGLNETIVFMTFSVGNSNMCHPVYVKKTPLDSVQVRGCLFQDFRGLIFFCTT